MWIGELNDRCGNCSIIDYCAEPYCTPHICAYEELEDASVELYKRMAESVTEEEIEDKLRQYQECNVSPWDDERNGAICDIVLEKMFYRE